MCCAEGYAVAHSFARSLAPFCGVFGTVLMSGQGGEKSRKPFRYPFPIAICRLTDLDPLGWRLGPSWPHSRACGRRTGSAGGGFARYRSCGFRGACGSSPDFRGHQDARSCGFLRIQYRSAYSPRRLVMLRSPECLGLRNILDFRKRIQVENLVVDAE